MAVSFLPKSVLSVPQAADRLGVTAARVRAMIGAGLLDAVKVGGRWAVSAASVEQRLASPGKPGRNLSPRRAWGLLLLASGLRPTWLGASEVSRIRSWLKSDRLDDVLSRLGKRATIHSLRAHPSDLRRLSQEVVKAGISAASAYDIDLAPPGELLDGYTSDNNLAKLRDRFALQISPRANVVLRAVQGLWPFAEGTSIAPVAVVAADLLESDDARERRAGEQLIRKLTT